MSGGNASKSKVRSSKRQEGWEEAGGEFYQELYPGGEQELFENLQRADATKLATLLPSKQARNTTTVKRGRSQNERRQSTFARTTQSRDIHLSMLPDLSENLSNEERSWEEIMQIKAMPVPMSQKRELKARLQNATKLRLQGLEQLQWRQRKVWHRFRSRLGEVLAKLGLWHGSMRVIEGKFGTGVVSYFLFLRWLLFLNVAMSALTLCFLIAPNSLLYECFGNHNATAGCPDLGNSSGNVVLDFIQGTGWMEGSVLFYGMYSDQVLVYELPNFLGTMGYNMPLAYILVPITWALLSLVAVVTAGAKGFKERLVESEGQFYLYCNLVFGGWDFCVHNAKSAKIKHVALFNEIKGCLQEELYKEEKQSRTREGTLLLHLRRVLINAFVLLILVVSGVIIYLAFSFSTSSLYPFTGDLTTAGPNETYAEDLASAPSRSQIRNTLLEFLPYICIVVLNLFVPEVFGYLIGYEGYRPRHEILITLLRTVLLRLASFAVLLSQVYMQVRGVLGPEVGDRDCWETYVGQQFYKLIVTDFAVQFLMTFLVNFPRSFLGRHSNGCLKIIGTQGFYLPKHVLDIVYIQTIIWMGAFFCPFLPIIGVVFYFLLFYMKKFNCLVNCTPSPVVYRASKSKSLFMSVLLVGFVISVAPVAYSVAEMPPSTGCGPFRGYAAVWQFAVATFEGLPPLVRELVFLLGTATFAVPAFAICLLLLYYYWAVATANRHMVAVLRSQLVLEGHDKQFLLNRLSAFIRQHQKRCERRNRAGDDDSIRQGSK